VTDEAIVDRRALAPGLGKMDATIGQRVNEGTTRRYSTRPKRGQRFNRFVGGSISV
jgi:hypothetical protein